MIDCFIIRTLITLRIILLVRLWISSFTPKYGYCYTFNALANADRDPDIPRLASLTGKDYGTIFIKIKKSLFNLITRLM
jgi:hypothetical protein